MLRAQTCLNLYISIHEKGSCTYRAEDLSQHAGLPFKMEIKKQLVYVIRPLGHRFSHNHTGGSSDLIYRQRTRPVNKSPLSMHHTHKDTYTEIHSTEPLEAPRAFPNHYYMAFSI